MNRVIVSFVMSLTAIFGGQTAVFASGNTGETQKVETIDPQALQAYWWNYFQVEKEKLPERIKRFNVDLETIRNSLKSQSNDENSHILFLIKQIEINLKTLPEITNGKAKVRAVYQPPEKPYTLETLIKLGKDLRGNKERITNLQESVTMKSSTAQTESLDLDNLMALYLNLSKDDPSRLKKGLEIISEKLDLVAQEYQLKHLREDLDHEKERRGLIERSINDVRTHLQLDPKMQSDLEKATSKLETSILNQQQEVYKALSDLNAKLEGKETSEFDLTLAKQRVIGERAKLANLKVQQLTHELKGIFFTLLFEKETKIIEEQIKSFPTLSQALTMIQKDSGFWQQSTQSTLTSALQSLSEKNGDKAASTRQVVAAANQNLLTINQLNNDIFVAQFLLGQLKEVIQEKFVSFWEYVKTHSVLFMNFLEKGGAFFHHTLFKVGETPVTLWIILRVILIAAIAYVLAKLIQIAIRRLGAKSRRIEPSAVYTLSRVVYYIIFYFGLFIALSSAGIELTAVAFIAGAITFWLGWGLAPIVLNFAAGILVLLDKNIRKGDTIELETGEKGILSEMNVRSSILFKTDGKKMIIPNAELVTKKLTNSSLSIGMQQLIVPFEISAAADETLVRQLILDHFKNFTYASKHHTPELFFVSMDKERLHFKLKVWIHHGKERLSPDKLLSDALFDLRSLLKKNNIPL